MNKFSLPTELNQLIVDGILNGYKEYLEERRAKKEKYIVSTGFSWSKANIIDTYVATACSKFEGVSYKVDKAGYTWEYVQFTLKHAQESFLFIVKNSWGIDRTFNGKIDKNKKESYLYDYAGINNSIVNSKSLKTLPSNKNVQLEFPLSEEEQFEKSIDDQNLKHYNRFYVVVYEFDAQSKMISKIALTLPDQQNMRLIEVADLTDLIEKSTSKITLDELDVVKNDKVPSSTFVDDNQLFGYEIAAEDQESSK